MTPEERKSADKPEYQGSIYHGRIVASRDGKELSFADGQDVDVAHWDGAKIVFDPDASFTTDPYIGDLGECTTDAHSMWFCKALHDGQEVYITGKPETADSVIPPSTPSNVDMITADVDLGDRSVEAQVDTGSGYPISMPSGLADDLVKRRLATRAGSTKTTLADGSKREVAVVMIEGHC